MQPTSDPYDYSTERLLRVKAREVAELRELLAAVAGVVREALTELSESLTSTAPSASGSAGRQTPSGRFHGGTTGTAISQRGGHE